MVLGIAAHPDSGFFVCFFVLNLEFKILLFRTVSVLAVFNGSNMLDFLQSF